MAQAVENMSMFEKYIDVGIGTMVSSDLSVFTILWPGLRCFPKPKSLNKEVI